jgi:hypothetical protein
MPDDLPPSPFILNRPLKFKLKGTIGKNKPATWEVEAESFFDAWLTIRNEVPDAAIKLSDAELVELKDSIKTGKLPRENVHLKDKPHIASYAVENPMHPALSSAPMQPSSIEELLYLVDNAK